MKNFFTTDYHFMHNNVIRYDNRPFENIYHMGEVIVEKHNSIVSNEDHFYYLGDFCVNTNKLEEYLSRLSGKKFFIKGNHDKDKHIKIFEKYGEYLGEQKRIHINGQDIVLNHFAMRVWDKHHHGAIHLYGHSHNSLEKFPNGKSMDVFIGNNNYYPYELNDIIKILNKREIQNIDHHKHE